MPIADELDWLCAAADDLLRAREPSSARCVRVNEEIFFLQDSV